MDARQFVSERRIAIAAINHDAEVAREYSRILEFPSRITIWDYRMFVKLVGSCTTKFSNKALIDKLRSALVEANSR